MKRLINYFLNPDTITFTFYGTLSFVCLVVYVWTCAFISLDFIIRMNDLIFALLLLLSIALIISIILGKKFGWALKRYFLVSSVQLILIWAVSYPIRTWQIDSTVEKSKQIITAIEKYKQEFGEYASTLAELEQKFNLDLPTRTNIGTKYHYETKENREYYLWFSSYYGYYAYYQPDKDEWTFSDGF